MNEFTERFKSKSNTELLNILENPTEFQELAVEAAKSEISDRNLSENEINEAKEELTVAKQEKDERIQRKKEQEEKVLEKVSSVIEIFNPIQKSALTPERLIRMITLVFGLIALYRLYSQFGLIQFMLTDDSSAGWDMSMVEYFIPLILLPIAIVLFWLRKKTGWILMAAFLTYSTITTLGLLIMTWNMEPLGVSALDNLFPQASSITQLMTILFYGGTLWVLTKRDIKEHFEINRPTTIGTISITGILTLLMIAPYF